MVTWLRNPSAAKIFVINEGRDPFNQNFRTFRSKTQWIGSVQPEKFRKNGSTFWGGLLFPVGPVGILVEWIAPEISVSLQKKSPNWMSFSSLNRTKCVWHQGICISNESFFFFFFFFFIARPDEEGQATSPLESLFDSPQLSVYRMFKSIAQQNTPCRLY